MAKPLGPNPGLRNISNGSQSNLANGAGQGQRVFSEKLPSTNARQNPNMTRAERFEDEKLRIIESCFSKLDAHGQLAESYITHVRITEDANYPSAPPPPDSGVENKKPRVIVVAVRNTGRVRMHKARENANGSFSIGKTWNLEELSAIESFSAPSKGIGGDRDAELGQWAGDTGFTVTITKPYFWQAGTSKEKDFFIASTVKIFRKYTRGQVPELRGFSDAERALMLGASASTTTQPAQPMPPPPLAQTRRESSPAPPHPPFAQREHSRDGSRYRGSPGPPPSISDRATRPSSRHDDESPVRHNGLQPPTGPRAFASQEQLRGPSFTARSDLRPGTSPAGGTSQTRPPPVPSPLVLDSNDTSKNSYISSSQPPPAAVNAVRSRGSENGASKDNTRDTKPVTVESQPFSTRPAPATTTRPVSRDAPQLPPITTGTSLQTGLLSETSANAPPPASTRDVSSTGAANVTSDEIVKTEVHRPSIPFSQNPGSPATPERSSRRPTYDSRTSEDLRPEPLMAATRPLSGATKPQQQTDLPIRNSVPDDPTVRPLSIKQNRTSNPATIAAPAPASSIIKDNVPGPTASERVSLGADAANDQDDQFRPGLGPMIKKSAARDRFKKAAAAASAFKPRPGGAAEKIMRAKAEREAGIAPAPDGITSVVPRPQALQSRQASTDDVIKAATPDAEPSTPITSSIPQSPPEIDIQAATPIAKTIPGRPTSSGVARNSQTNTTGPVTPKRQSRQSAAAATDVSRQIDEDIDDDAMHDSVIAEVPVKAKVRSQYQNQCLDELGIDRGLLEGKGLDFEAMLETFGWKDDALHPSKLANLQNALHKEQAQLEAGTWLSTGTDTARDEKVARVEALLDKTIAECDELDGLLTLYSVELGSLGEDITYIEAQSQGLQVQSANQQLLQSELQTLLMNMSLDRRALDPLQYADLSDSQQFDEVESSLVKLYKALITLDPTIKSSDRGRRKRRSAFAGEEGSELAAMQAVKDKKDRYHHESSIFCQRLMQHLDTTFTLAFNDAKKHAIRPLSSSRNTIKDINRDAFGEAHGNLWSYHPTLLFTKEIDPPAWGTILRMYYSRAQPLYADAFAQNIASWKDSARKPSAEDAEALFTTALKQETTAPGAGPGSMGLAAARKLTVKRSATLARTLRYASGEKSATNEIRQPTSGGMACETFGKALEGTASLVSQEQNFIVEFFHASSLEQVDFLDVIRNTPPEKRFLPNLLDRKPVEADRDMAKRVQGLMGELFDSNFAAEMQRFIDWSISQDPLQGVGIMTFLAKQTYLLQDTSQEYLLHVLETLSGKLHTRWTKFVEDQIRAIEDTKVKIKKRKGVIGFIKVFPTFSVGVENIFGAAAGLDYDGPSENVASVRELIDAAYAVINRTMFDSLKAIAKESPTTIPSQQQNKGMTATGEDPEDKEMLNYHILLIENMNHYVEGVDDGGKEGVLAEWRGRAMMERAEALEAYVSRVLTRPLGKLIEYLESVSSLLSTSTSSNPQAVAARPSYSRKAARNLLAQYEAKEVRRGIETLRRRIEKHFGEGDDESFSRQLVGLVCKECERGYEHVLERTQQMITEVYPPIEGEKPVEVDFSTADIQAGFRR